MPATFNHRAGSLVGPPQSWQTTVSRSRSSWRTSATRFGRMAIERVGMVASLASPKPIWSGTITRWPAAMRGRITLRRSPSQTPIEQIRLRSNEKATFHFTSHGKYSII